MGMMSEFKDFAVKGNVVDMAVGLVIGAAFGKIITAFVKHVITPPIGLMMGGVDFSDLKITLKEATADAAAVTIDWGIVAQTLLDFIIIAFAIFMVVRAINNAKKKEAEVPAEPSEDILLLREISKNLKK